MITFYVMAETELKKRKMICKVKKREREKTCVYIKNYGGGGG
jgi:hypothetical protein